MIHECYIGLDYINKFNTLVCLINKGSGDGISPYLFGDKGYSLIN